MRNTFVTLFWRTETLEETIDWLIAHGYQVTRLDASRWTTAHDLHTDIATALDLPDYYGRNLDAVNDCIRDVVSYDYGWRPDVAGLVLVFTGYDHFARRCAEAAQSVLDIMADHGRSAALVGRRLMCLAQSDDPDIRFKPVGAMPVMWNDAEWLDAKRHPRP